ncbi:DNA-binding transcriptional regulator LsrR (DeoR family) [Serratia sp. 509]
MASELDRRLTSVNLHQWPEKPVIALAGGKASGHCAALFGRWINGLVTDEESAWALLAD